MPLEQPPRDLMREGIEFYRRVPLLAPRDTYAKLEKLGYRGQDHARRVISLPMHPYIDLAIQERVAKAVAEAMA